MFIVQLTTEDISSGNGHLIKGRPILFPEVHYFTRCKLSIDLVKIMNAMCATFLLGDNYIEFEYLEALIMDLIVTI